MKIQILKDELVVEKDKDGHNRKSWNIAIKIIDNEVVIGMSDCQTMKHTGQKVILKAAELEKAILSILSNKLARRITK